MLHANWAKPCEVSGWHLVMLTQILLQYLSWGLLNKFHPTYPLQGKLVEKLVKSQLIENPKSRFSRHDLKHEMGTVLVMLARIFSGHGRKGSFSWPFRFFNHIQNHYPLYYCGPSKITWGCRHCSSIVPFQSEWPVSVANKERSNQACCSSTLYNPLLLMSSY